MSSCAPCLALCAVVALLAGCCTAPKEPLLTAPDGRKLCAVHHAPLVREKAYRVDPGIVCLLPVEGYFAAARCFPNGIDTAHALTRSEIFTVPDSITYCRACEEAIARRLR